MIHLFPLNRVITYIAAGYSILPVLILYFTWPTAEPVTIYSAVRIALTGSAALGLALYLFFAYAWRWIWRLFPRLNTSVFPDLNGRWDMRIEWNQQGRKGVKEATAIIRQSFLKVSMEVDSKDSNSETLLAQPKKDPESGRPALYYVYRVTPKHTAGELYPPYNGSAALRLSPTSRLTLEGNYFTDAKSQGHFHMTRCSRK